LTCRGDELIEEAAKWISAGGIVDFTADQVHNKSSKAAQTLNLFRQRGLNLSNISVSSDAFA
jgi:hypothetical protein